MKFWFQIITAAVMVLLAVWQWTQMRRHPHDAALRVLAVGVTTIAVVLLYGTKVPPFDSLHDLLDPLSFSNIAWGFLYYCYSVFFLLAQISDDPTTRRGLWRRARLEFLSWIVFLGLALAMYYTYQPESSYATLQNIIYYLGIDVYTLALWLLGTLRAVSYIRRLNHTWAVAAAIGVITAMGLMTFGVNGVTLVRQGLYLLFPGSRWPGLRTLYNVLRLGGQILLVIALSSAPLMAVVVRLRERRTRQLRQRFATAIAPLHHLLITEFPQIALPSGSDSTGPVPPLNRMVIEVSDGLAYLAPWGSAAATPDDQTVPDHIAAALHEKRTAAQARHATPSESDSDGLALPQWEPDFDPSDWRRRAQWMADLSRQLSESGISAKQNAVDSR